ncbi:nitroreductase [Candidatus Micrarchaeota archaeon]|nr:nitroreductase [Candidatus Micrarchaeota archaeon]
MEFYDVIQERHSCRSFLEKEVENEKLRRILGAVLQAPSAGNLQAYRIYVVRSREAREGIARAALDQQFIAKAPIVLVFCADKSRSEMRYGQRGMELYALQDATIAAAYAQLAARAEGICSVWVGAFEPLEVSYQVNTESSEVPVAIVPLGYSEKKPEQTPRRPFGEVVKEV